MKTPLVRLNRLFFAASFINLALIIAPSFSQDRRDEPGDPGEPAKAPVTRKVDAATSTQAQIVVKDAPAAEVRMLTTHPTLVKSLLIYEDKSVLANPNFPPLLEGSLFYELAGSGTHEYECRAGGDVLALARSNPERDDTKALTKLGFQRVEEIVPFQFYGDKPNDVFAVYRKHLTTGETFSLPGAITILGFDVPRPERGGEVLYNGIRLPREWPPDLDLSTDEPIKVPYLENGPKLISISVGRQFFVDDFLIEKTDLEREYHHPTKYEGNPILKPETDLEKKGLNGLAAATPKSGGLWWNPEKKLFELWYEAGWVSTIAYATSRDGLHWDRPNLPVVPGTNQVLPPKLLPDSWTVVRDYRATDPKENFKIFLRGSHSKSRARGFLSADGLDWGEFHTGGITGDRSTMFYNPFRKKWVYSLRWASQAGRSRGYWEGDDFLEGLDWLPDEPKPWARTDKLDPPDPRIGDKPQLYNLDAVAYESIMLGFFEIVHGPGNQVAGAKGLPKYTGLNFAYSRDGFHWSRPDRTMAINSEQREAWDRGYVQSIGNICTVRGDQLWFYYIGFAGDPSKPWTGENPSTMESGMYANGATGVAFLRRDGFVSLNAGAEARTLTTRPLTFSGRYLFANIDAPEGELLAEVVGMDGKVIEPFSFANCIPLKGDTTIGQIRWKGGEDLNALSNRAVRLRFQLTKGKFYSFWMSVDESGRSDGYVAGGGPGYTSDVDTVGQAALEADRKLRAGSH